MYDIDGSQPQTVKSGRKTEFHYRVLREQQQHDDTMAQSKHGGVVELLVSIIRLSSSLVPSNDILLPTNKSSLLLPKTLSSHINGRQLAT